MARSLDVRSTSEPSFERHPRRIEIRQRHAGTRRSTRPESATPPLGVRPGVALGPDARRAAGLARAAGDQIARALEQQRVHVEQRPAEADAAGIVVVDEDVRLRRRAPSGTPSAAARARRTLERAAVDREADVVAVAHQQQLRDVLHRERQADDAVAPVVAAERQRRHDRRRNRQPVRRRVHLLFGQIQLARADVLVGVELDLLEPDDARDDVDFAVRSSRRTAPAARAGIGAPRALISRRPSASDNSGVG